ncbi:MAG TPA: PKD domain-containing protein, partial [Elusimicrobiota bacterium]|nr:PKD domain-containing protein [Elusimicrobiota bacterium]
MLRYRRPQTLIALSLLLAPAMFAQAPPAPRPFITNYQFVSQIRISSTQSDLTYHADIINPGQSLTPLTAILTSLDPSKVRVVQGQGSLNFPAVPAYGQATSSNTFTVLVNDGAPLDFGNLQWTFLAPVANAGQNQTVKVGNTVTLDGSGSTNPTGIGTLSYNWAFRSRPDGSNAALMNPTTALPSFLVDAPG